MKDKRRLDELHKALKEASRPIKHGGKHSMEIRTPHGSWRVSRTHNKPITILLHLRDPDNNICRFTLEGFTPDPQAEKQTLPEVEISSIYYEGFDKPQWGSKDYESYPSRSKIYCKPLRRSQRVTIPGVAHVPFMLR